MLLPNILTEGVSFSYDCVPKRDHCMKGMRVGRVKCEKSADQLRERRRGTRKNKTVIAAYGFTFHNIYFRAQRFSSFSCIVGPV